MVLYGKFRHFLKWLRKIETESSLIWSKAFLVHWVPHDAATTRFNRWLWQWLYIAFSLMLSKSAERPETVTAPPYSFLWKEKTEKSDRRISHISYRLSFDVFHIFINSVIRNIYKKRFQSKRLTWHTLNAPLKM